jgi:hypothetical protein
MNPRLIRTGNPLVDRQNRELVNAIISYSTKVTISGWPRPVIKSVAHMLGRKPQSWQVVRAMPADGVTGSPQEVRNGYWGRDAVEIEFPGNGTWTIRFQ